MAEPKSDAFSWPLIAAGISTAAAGGYFGLVGLAAVPPPSSINGPLWLSLLVALIFMAAGIAMIVSGATGAYDRSGDLPADAPVWVAVVYWLAGIAMASGLAALGTWVAFGAGTRHFSMTGFISGAPDEIIGRTVFGLGAIITWLLVAVMARSGAKKIFAKKN